jgi:hypothetical protein
METIKRYCIVGDQSGHDYFVPVERKEEWMSFLELDEDDPGSWDVPEWAERIDGTFTFTDPRCE